jgi:hypothetical protein
MKRTAEYGTYPDSARSVVKVIARQGKYTLKHHTAGYEPAGSCARYTDEVWSITFELDGSTHGRRFRDQWDAHKLFDAWAFKATAKARGEHVS